MPNSLCNRTLFLINLFLFSSLLSGSDKYHPDDVINQIRSAILAPGGYSFDVFWTYEYDDDLWSGEGDLKVLRGNYLLLTLDHQQVLIKNDTLFTFYHETGQVVADWFDRKDPANFFSILLGELPSFKVIEVKDQSDSQVAVTLRADTMVGFDQLSIIVDSQTWLPISMTAEAGEDILVSVVINKVETLADPFDLIHGILKGTEFIDLRK